MSDVSPQSVGDRLALLRKVREIPSQAEMARLIGCELKRYNHWERGRGQLPVEFAIEIAKLTGANLDYIYLGDMSALPKNLWTLLAELSSDNSGSTARRG